MKRLALILLVFGTLFSGGPFAVAAEVSMPAQQLTVNAVVPPLRVVYVGADDNVQKVEGNTSENITPTVTSTLTRQEIPMTAAINDQYQQILTAHGGQLVPGQTYLPAPRAFGFATDVKISGLKLQL